MMIKCIAIDFNSLVEVNKEVVKQENKIINLFALEEKEYKEKVIEIVGKNWKKYTKDLFNRLYKNVKYDLFLDIKRNYPELRLILFTKNIPLIKEYIDNNFDVSNIDDIIYVDKDIILDIKKKYNIKDNELLLITNDKLTSNSIKVINTSLETNIFLEVCMILDWE